MKYLSKPKYLLIAALLMTLFALISCGGGGSQENAERSGGESDEGDREGKESEQAGDGSENMPSGVPVRVLDITLGEISTGILSTAVIEAEQTVDIYARVTGIVTELAAEEGQTVVAGRTLCLLEDEELKLAESKARSVREKAQRDLDRIKLQVARKVLAVNDLIEAEYIFEQARIDWEQKKTSLDYTNVTSTINGIISERLVRLGQKVDPTTKLYTLFDPKSLVVNVHIPESDYFTMIAQRRASTRAVLTSESLPEMEFRGSIKRIAPVVNPETNTIKITVKYGDPRRVLRPGMYVRVKLVTDTHADAVLIPKSAILYEESLMYIFVVREGKASRVTLEPGYSNTEYVETLSGVDGGDMVVVVGQTGLKDGTSVRLVEHEEPEGGDSED